MTNNDKFEYFMEQTNTRLQAIDEKMDKMLAFKFMLVGASVAASSVVTFIINLIFIYLESHH